MTLPALTDAELAQVKVYAGAAALRYHNSTLPEESRVDLSVSFAVHGDLRLVAADVLEAVCLHASGQPTGSAAAKRIKVGKIEIEKAASTARSELQVNAEAWCARAVRLRQDAGRRTGLIRSPLATMRAGGNPVPTFSIGPPARLETEP